MHFPKTPRWVIPVVVCLSLAGLYLVSPVQNKKVVLAPKDIAYWFGDTRTVGQSFEAKPSLSSITVPMTLRNGASGAVIFHLRLSKNEPDIRTVEQKVRQGDNVFRFDSVSSLHATSYYWELESPGNKDGTVGVMYEQDSNTYPEGVAYMKDAKLQGHFGFTISYLTNKFQWLSVLLFKKPLSFAEVSSLIFGILATTFVFAFFPYARKKNTLYIWSIAAAMMAILILVLHIYLSSFLPVINDEGAYLQDVRQWTFNVWPFRDYLTKGPLYIAILKVWDFITPNNIVALRGLSSLSAVVTALLVGYIARRFRFHSTIVVASIAFTGLTPAVLGLTTPLLLQVVSLSFVLGGFASVIKGVQSNKRVWIVVGAIVMSLAFFARISSVAGIIITGIYILVRSRHRLRDALVYTGIILGTFAVVFASSLPLIGIEKTAVMFNLESLLISSERSQVHHGSSDTLLRQWMVNGRQLWYGAPIIMSLLFATPLLLLRRNILSLFAASGILLFFEYEVIKNLFDMSFLLPRHSVLSPWLILFGIVSLPSTLLLWRIFSKNQDFTTKRLDYFELILIFAWVFLLGFLYQKWGSFKQSYIIEFIPLLSITAAWVLNIFYVSFGVVARRVAVSTIAGFYFATFIIGFVLMQAHPPSGTITQKSLDLIVREIDSIVPEGTPIFTAQSTVTAMANRPVMFNYSHSGWYLYEKGGTVPTALRKVFFAEPSVVTEYLDNNVEFVLDDLRTNEVYFKGYSDRIAILDAKFKKVKDVYNDLTDQPFTLYQRIR